MEEDLNNEQKTRSLTDALQLATNAVMSFSVDSLGNVDIQVVEVTNNFRELSKALDDAAKSIVEMDVNLTQAGYMPDFDVTRPPSEEALSRSIKQQLGQPVELQEAFGGSFPRYAQYRYNQDRKVDPESGQQLPGYMQARSRTAAETGDIGEALSPQDLNKYLKEWLQSLPRVDLTPLTPRIREVETRGVKPEIQNVMQELAGSIGGGRGDGGDGGDGGDRETNQQPEGRENLFQTALLFGLLKQLNDTVSEFQSAALSRGFERPMSVLNNSISNNIPAMTELKVSTALLKTGLEDNSGRIAQYIARSELLGENSLQLAMSIRSLTSNLGLNSSEQGALVKSIADASVRYKVSTDELAAKMASLTEKIGLISITGDQSTMEAFAKLEALTGRKLPEGTLEKTFVPMMTGDLGVVGAAQYLGVERERATIANMSGSISAEDKLAAMLSLLEKSAARGEQVGGFSGDVNLMRSMTGGVMQPLGGADFFINARAVSEAANRPRTAEEEREARLSDASAAIGSLVDRLYEPLALAGQSLLKLIELFPTISSGIIQVLVAGTFVKAISAIRNFISQVPSLLTQMLNSLNVIAAKTGAPITGLGPDGAGGPDSKIGFFENLMMEGEIGFDKIKDTFSKVKEGIVGIPSVIQTGATKAGAAAAGARAMGVAGVARTAGVAAMGAGRLLSGFLGGPFGIALTALSFLPTIADSLFGVEDNTDKIKENTKKDPIKPIESTARESLLNQASLISMVSNETVRTSMLMSQTDRTDIQAQHAQLQLDRLGQIVDRLTEIKDKRSPLPDRMSKSVKD